MSAQGATGPFKGLASFQDSEADERLFFGRGREREIIVANLLASRLTVLYGDTGVGKSSVLRAGVARDLRALPEPLAVVVFGEWRDDPARALEARIAETTGADTQGRLADTLELGSALAGGEVVVLLDGLEEEFLYHGDDAGPGSFLDEFSEAATRPGLRASFLLTVREDALAKLDRFKSRVPNVFGNYLRLEHLDRTAGREAIVGPIDRWNESTASGVEIEPALVEAVLDQVAAGKVELGQAGRGGVDENGARGIEAPFLQLVMARLWDAEAEAGSAVLRLETLDRLGGAEEIVRDHLDRALESLIEEQRDIAAAVFNHLVTPSGAKIAHDASDLAGYLGASPPDVEPVLSTLAAERILRPVPGARGSPLPRYEIYHDILAEAVLAWRTRHESGRALERVRQDAARRHRRLVVFAVAALVLAGAMAVVTVYAFSQRSEAQSQARRSRARALDASALSLLSTDPQLSELLAVKAARLDRGGRAESVLRQAVAASRERGVFHAAGPVVVARYSPDGKRFIVAGGDVARVYDARTRRRLLTLPQHARVTAADFSPDGRLILTAGADGRILLRSSSGGTLLPAFRLRRAVRSARFDSSGTRIVAVGARTVAVWPLAGGGAAWEHHLAWPVTEAIFSPDASLVAVIGNDREALVYDATSGTLYRRFDQGDFVKSIAFSPNGAYLVSGGRNDTARIWDVRTGQRLAELTGHKQDVVAIAFAPNGLTVATGSLDGTARTWSVPGGKPIGSFVGHTGGVTSVAFSPDAAYLLTASSDRTARVWKNTRTPEVFALLAGHRGAVSSAVYSPDGGRRRVLTASSDGTARLWEPHLPTLDVLARFMGPVAETFYDGPARIAVVGPGHVFRFVRSSDGTTVRSFGFRDRVVGAALSGDRRLLAIAHGRRLTFVLRPRAAAEGIVQPVVVTSVAIAPDASFVVTGGTDGIARVWSSDGRLRLELKSHHRLVTDVAVSPDGTRIATSSNDSTAKVWDATTGKLLHTLPHPKPVTSVAFSPGGSRVLTASKDDNARLWSVSTGARIQTLSWHFGTVADAEYSPDGRWIVTAGPGTVQLWQPGVLDPVDPLFPLRGIGGPSDRLTSAVFDPTSRIVLAASKDGTVRTYRCSLCGSLDELLRLAHPRRSLIPAELRKYGG